MKLIGDIPQSQLDKLKQVKKLFVFIDKFLIIYGILSSFSPNEQIFYTIDSDQNGTLTLEELLEGIKY